MTSLFKDVVWNALPILVEYRLVARVPDIIDGEVQTLPAEVELLSVSLNGSDLLARLGQDSYAQISQLVSETDDA